MVILLTLVEVVDIIQFNAGVAELADAPDSKSDGTWSREGSTPSSGTLNSLL